MKSRLERATPFQYITALLVAAASILGLFATYLAFFVVVWYFAIWTFGLPGWLVPTPFAVARSLAAVPGFYAHHAGYTVVSSGLGLMIAATFGIITGVVLDLSVRLRRVTIPVLVSIQTFPIVAIAPLITVALGYGIASKVFITFFICCLPCIFATVRGLQSTPTAMSIYAQTLGMSTWQRYWFIKLPMAVPNVATGIRIAGPIAVVGTVVGEFAGSKGVGLGYVILTSTSDLGVERAYAALILLGTVGGLFYLATALLERAAYTVAGLRESTE